MIPAHDCSSGKYLQAARALKQANSLDADHPELHVRLVDFRKRGICSLVSTFPWVFLTLRCVPLVSSLSQMPPDPIGTVLKSALSDLLPEEVSLETFNSQYLQRHSTSCKAILASTKVLHKLGTPVAEIESTAFGSLNPEVSSDFAVRFSVASGSFGIMTEFDLGTGLL